MMKNRRAVDIEESGAKVQINQRELAPVKYGAGIRLQTKAEQAGLVYQWQACQI